MYDRLVSEINDTFSGRGTDTVLEYWEGVKIAWFHTVTVMTETNVIDAVQASKLINLIINNFHKKYEEFI